MAEYALIPEQNIINNVANPSDTFAPPCITRLISSTIHLLNQAAQKLLLKKFCPNLYQGEYVLEYSLGDRKDTLVERRGV